MYWLWGLYYGNLDLLRQDLKSFRVVPAVGFEEQAEIIEKILPFMVDKLTDDDLLRLLDLIVDLQSGA